MRYVDLNILKEEDDILTFLFPSSEYGYLESPIILFYFPEAVKRLHEAAAAIEMEFFC